MTVQDFNKKFNPKRIKRIACGGGIISLAIGLSLLIPRVHIILLGTSTEATIVSNRSERHAVSASNRSKRHAVSVSNNSTERIQTIYYPTVEFKDAASEKLIRKTIKKGSEFYNYAEGEKAIVHYLPEHPKEFLLGQIWTWLIIPGMLTGIGALFLLAGLTVRNIPDRNPPSLGKESGQATF